MEKCNIELQKKDPKKDTLPERAERRSESKSGNKIYLKFNQIDSKEIIDEIIKELEYAANCVELLALKKIKRIKNAI